MKFFFVFLEVIIFSFQITLVCQTNNSDSSLSLPNPKFYTNTNLLFGAEVIDPLHPQEFFSRATRIWKSDIRVGMIQQITSWIEAKISVRGQDSPETNSIKFYEVYASINHDWGKSIFGQERIQSGNKSKYLNDAFDRSLWDKGLIYDFLFRGIKSTINLNNSDINFFLGSDYSSGFISGTTLSTKICNVSDLSLSALYVVRDPQYAGFGWQFGGELINEFENFHNYNVISYKTFFQEPANIYELTLFTEEYFLLSSKLETGFAFYYKKMNSILVSEEIRSRFMSKYKINNFFSPAISIEYFNVYNYYEIQIGLSAYLNYTDHLRIVPRVCYIITEFGKDIGFLGIEGRIIF